MNLLQRINEVRKSIAYIQKDKSVDTGRGSYRAVTHDTVTAMVRPAMIEHGIVCFPSLVESFSMPKENPEAKQFRYEATYDFTFCNIEDEKDRIVIRIESHAMDNADKAPGKALSYAKKYAMLKLFEIETGEDDESRFNPEGLSDDVLKGYIDDLDNAKDFETLKSIFGAAYRAAGDASDKDSQQALTRVYNTKKVSFVGGDK